MTHRAVECPERQVRAPFPFVVFRRCAACAACATLRRRSGAEACSTVQFSVRNSARLRSAAPRTAAHRFSPKPHRRAAPRRRCYGEAVRTDEWLTAANGRRTHGYSRVLTGAQGYSRHSRVLTVLTVLTDGPGLPSGAQPVSKSTVGPSGSVRLQVDYSQYSRSLALGGLPSAGAGPSRARRGMSHGQYS
jgi:hypothetical protein